MPRVAGDIDLSTSLDLVQHGVQFGIHETRVQTIPEMILGNKHYFAEGKYKMKVKSPSSKSRLFDVVDTCPLNVFHLHGVSR